MAVTKPTKRGHTRTIKLNRTAIGRLPVAKEKSATVRFEGFPGLQLTSWPSGRRVFEVKKKPTGGSAPVKVGIADYGQMPLLVKEAKEQALTDSIERSYQAIILQLKKGLNPNHVRKAQRQEREDKQRRDAATSYTLGQAFSDYLENSELADNTLAGYRNAIDNHLEEWKPLELATITGRMVRDKHQQLSKESPTVANHIFRVFRAVYSFAEEEIADSTGGEKLLPRNPVKTLSPKRKGAKARWNIEQRRTRYIKPDQLKNWIAAVNKLPELQDSDTAERNRDYLLLLITSGCRRREITCDPKTGTGLLWQHIDLKRRSYELVDNKSSRPVVLPLSDWQVEILKRRKQDTGGKGGPFPLQEPRKFIAKVVTESGIEFSAHDLRRSFATYADNLYLHERVIKALLNHSLQQSSDVTAGYIQIEFARLRQATQQITDYIRSQGGLVDNVVQLPKAKRGRA